MRCSRRSRPARIPNAGAGRHQRRAGPRKGGKAIWPFDMAVARAWTVHSSSQSAAMPTRQPSACMSFGNLDWLTAGMTEDKADARRRSRGGVRRSSANGASNLATNEPTARSPPRRRPHSARSTRLRASAPSPMADEFARTRHAIERSASRSSSARSLPTHTVLPACRLERWRPISPGAPRSPAVI